MHFLKLFIKEDRFIDYWFDRLTNKYNSGNKIRYVFNLKHFFGPKSFKRLGLLTSKLFSRDQDQPNWFDAMCVIWCFMSNDEHDILNMTSIVPILVSNELPGCQQSHLLIWFWLNNVLKWKDWKLFQNFTTFIYYEIPLYFHEWKWYLTAELLDQLGFWNFKWLFIYSKHIKGLEWI